MANRDFNRKQALEKEVKEIYAEISIGASGAPTITYATGVSSVSRTSAGLYVVVLQDAYIKLMHANVEVQSSAAQDLAAQTAAADVNNKVYSFRTVAAGVETDPTSGTVLRMSLQLKNSWCDNMFMGDKKKHASMIIASMNGAMKPALKNEAGDVIDSSAGHDAAAQEILDAVKSNDAEGLKSALKSFVQMCQDEYEASESPAEESSEASEE